MFAFFKDFLLRPEALQSIRFTADYITQGGNLNVMLHLKWLPASCTVAQCDYLNLTSCDDGIILVIELLCFI